MNWETDIQNQDHDSNLAAGNTGFEETHWGLRSIWSSWNVSPPDLSFQTEVQWESLPVGQWRIPEPQLSSRCSLGPPSLWASEYLAWHLAPVRRGEASRETGRLSQTSLLKEHKGNRHLAQWLNSLLGTLSFHIRMPRLKSRLHSRIQLPVDAHLLWWLK